MIRLSRTGFPAKLMYAFFLWAFLAGTGTAAAERRPVLLVSGSQDRTPYLMIDHTTGEARGALHDLIMEACDAAGVDALFLVYPWKRVLDYLDYGDIDIVAGLYSTVERRGQFIFSSPIHSERVRIFTAKPLTINNFDDLKGLRGDAHLGASYGDVADAKIGLFLDVTRWTDKARSLLRLVEGDTDYVICPEGDCSTIARNKGLDTLISMQPYILAEMEVYIAFTRHPKHPELVEAVSQELERLIRSGRGDELLARYQK